MRRRELDDLITRRLTDVLTEHGFEYDRAEQAFVRSIEEGYQSISVAIADYRPHFDFSPTFCIRIDEAEVIGNRFNDVAAGFADRTPTMMIQSDVLLGIDEWDGETDEELLRAVDDMVGAIRTKGLPFLERHRDLASVDRALNDGRQPPYDSSVSPGREMHSITVAHLAGNPRFDSLAEDYLRALSPSHVGRPRIAALIDYLRSIRARID